MQIRRMLLEGSPVIVAMRPHESPSRWRMFCISSARFRLTPLRRPRCLPVALDPLQPRQRTLPGKVTLHLREDDGQAQRRPAHGAVIVDGLPEADDLDARSHAATPAAPKPRSATGPGGPAPPPSRSRPAGGRPSGDSAQAGSKRPSFPRPRRPAHSRPAPALGLQVVGVGIAGHRHAGVSIESFHSSFAGPRFWHGGDATAGGVLAMLTFVSFWQDWSGGTARN